VTVTVSIGSVVDVVVDGAAVDEESTCVVVVDVDGAVVAGADVAAGVEVQAVERRATVARRMSSRIRRVTVGNRTTDVEVSRGPRAADIAPSIPTLP